MSKIATQITKLEAALAAAQASIVGIEAKLAELRPQLEAEQAAAALAAERESTGYAPGTKVAFDFGRATRTTLEGVVIAFAPKNDKVPATYAIQTGTGLDTKVVKVPAVAVTKLDTDTAEA